MKPLLRCAIGALALLALGATDVPQADWTTTGGDFAERHYSALGQVTPENVGTLGLAWYADLEADRGQEATPLVVDGVLYNTEPWNIVTAYDGRTGKVLWRYDPQVPLTRARDACCDVVTRGLGYGDGRIVVATLDGRLIALDAKTGRELWSANTIHHDWPYTITGAPRVFDGKVIIGNAGAEKGARGYVVTHDLATGRELWRWYIVPGDPALGFENAAMEKAAETWTGEYWRLGGGGTAWDAMSYDAELGLIYIGTGNGSPWVHRYRSPDGGDNLYLSSIVALDAGTGEYRWHYQTTPGESWDYTATANMVLTTLEIDGRPRKVLMQAPKNGFFYVIDRETGELLSARNILPVTWASGIDMKTGRPIEVPEARFGTTPVMVSPGPGGAHSWSPMAYSPQTGLVYIPVTETWFGYAAQPDWSPGTGNSIGTSYTGHDEERRRIAEYADQHQKGWLAAWDPVAQREVWRVPYAKKGSGGALATAGGLVFQGTIDTTFAAYRADTGEKVWEMPVQNVPMAAPITYMIDGEQYIAVNAGWGGGMAHVEKAAFSDLFLGKPRLLVFKLGGTATLPPLPPQSRQLEDLRAAPPPVTGTPQQIARGEEIYNVNCALCHGQGARGGIKDLRRMTPDTHAAFLDIVLHGARAAKGMASFGDLIDEGGAKAVHQYLIARANEDYQGGE